MSKYTSKETLLRRQKQRKARRLALTSLAVVFVLGISFIITSVINMFSKEEVEESFLLEPTTTTEPTENLNENLEVFPAMQTEPVNIIAPNSSNLSLPQNGRVHLNYFDTALFIGDSLGDGFREYQGTTGIDTATFFTNRNLQPASFLDGNYITLPDYEDPVDPMAEISAMAPEKIYVILGTNALHLSSEELLNDYSLLIDELKIAAPNAVIYINSILPVTAEKSAENDIYNPQKIADINNSLAIIASQKSVYFLNVQEIFATSEGHLNTDLDYDGIHLTPTGYKMWTDYLISHTVYNENSPFVVGSPYIKP